ncbi:MAG TPA: mechanosensitive ion channel family protein, partial [Flavobacteriales bacterium]|nr:mechanosensitive ion channel family protein [Flavobacteriales bacterium]
GGLAFALAAQDTIKNMFGSLMIFVDKPFQIGDLVSADGFTGTVEEVGFRSTRIRTGANSLISVPNGKLVDMVVDNLGMRQFRRYKTFINLTYDTPVELIELYVKGLRQIVHLHPQTRAEENEIHVNEMSTSSISILFNVFFSSTSWSEELKARHEIILETIRLAEALGVRLAFPTQTLHIESFPEKKSTVQTFVNPNLSGEQRFESYIQGLSERFTPKSIEQTNEHFE